jgi:hypothetical protein
MTVPRVQRPEQASFRLTGAGRLQQLALVVWPQQGTALLAVAWHHLGVHIAVSVLSGRLEMAGQQPGDVRLLESGGVGFAEIVVVVDLVVASEPSQHTWLPR